MKRPSARRAIDGTQTAVRCLLGALIVFVLNLGGFGSVVVRDINKTDEAAHESAEHGAQCQWSSAAPGDDTPDWAPTAPARPLPGALSADFVAQPPATPELADFRRGPSARAPPRHA